MSRKLLLYCLIIIAVGFFVKSELFSVNVHSENITGIVCCPDEQNPEILKLTEPEMVRSEVSEYQQALKQAGYYNGAVSGVYDRETEKAVKKFQQEHDLKPDGIIGSKTRETLANFFEDGFTPVSTPVAPKGEVEIIIDVNKRKLIVLDDKKKFKEFPVAVGKSETPTPVGEWKIVRKAKNWGTGFGTRWMGLNVPWGIYGIHGTNKPWSIGSYASHGCIRMFNKNVEELYEWVKVGTKVTIVGQIYPSLYEQRRVVHKGHKGSDVMLIQKGLIKEGYLKGEPDGIFGIQTENAIKKLQKDKGLEVTGQVEVDIWPILGL